MFLTSAAARVLASGFSCKDEASHCFPLFDGNINATSLDSKRMQATDATTPLQPEAAVMACQPSRALKSSIALRILPLDVTDPECVAKAVAKAGPIDVFANNASFGAPVRLN